VSVGRLWDRAKNARALAAAAPLIDGRVALIGPGHVDGGEIELLHVLDESGVIAWLSRAAVFAEPARYEPFGLAALEAALCGCALVLGDIPSLREVWGEAAVFVSPSDSVELARSVGALLEDPRRRSEAASRALEVARRYTPRAMADAYLSRYRRLARVPVSA
jgi:glycosyltransferase involved in cell wall biosynthesis